MLQLISLFYYMVYIVAVELTSAAVSSGLRPFPYQLSYFSGGRGHPLDAQTITCPTCRGMGRVSTL